MCLTPHNFTKAKFHGKILLHSCFSMVKGFQNWRPHEWRPQGRHYIGLDGLKLNFVHNFPTKQHFSMKFWILATLMLKGSHVTILVNFDQILGQNWSNLAKFWSKFSKTQKVTYFGSKNACFEILKNLTHRIRFWNLADIKIWSSGSNFSKFQRKHFWT